MCGNVVGYRFDGCWLHPALIERGETKLRQFCGDHSHWKSPEYTWLSGGSGRVSPPTPPVRRTRPMRALRRRLRRWCRCADRSEEHTSELQSLMRTTYAVFCLKIQHN